MCLLPTLSINKLLVWSSLFDLNEHITMLLPVSVGEELVLKNKRTSKLRVELMDSQPSWKKVLFIHIAF